MKSINSQNGICCTRPLAFMGCPGVSTMDQAIQWHVAEMEALQTYYVYSPAKDHVATAESQPVTICDHTVPSI